MVTATLKEFKTYDEYKSDVVRGSDRRSRRAWIVPAQIHPFSFTKDP